MFTYVLISACFVLFMSVFLKNYFIYMAVFAAWFGVIIVLTDMRNYQDVANSAPIEWIAVIIMGFALYSIVKLTQRGDGL